MFDTTVVEKGQMDFLHDGLADSSSQEVPALVQLTLRGKDRTNERVTIWKSQSILEEGFTSLGL